MCQDPVSFQTSLFLLSQTFLKFVPWEYCSTAKCQPGTRKKKLTEKHVDLQRQWRIILLERRLRHWEKKRKPWLICTKVKGFILPIFSHPDQCLIAEAPTISVALCGEHSKIDSQPQSFKPAVPLHAMQLPLPLFFFAAVVLVLLGPLWGGDKSEGFWLQDEKKMGVRAKARGKL